MGIAGPCYFVIFGATGNLATTHLLPALYQLDAAGRLNADLRFIAFARRQWTRTQWIEHLQPVVKQHLGADYDADAATRFAERFDYIGADLHDPLAYTRLMQELGKPRAGSCENIVFYLAIKPADFDAVVENLNRAGINRQRGRHRVVVEKPFGQDLASAQALNALLHKHFAEDQIFRIDHYLGKETVQNLFVFRFANTMVEPVWNRNFIDQVQITVAEEIGIATRADYYDHAGALRDMLQNHLMQLLTVVAMEPPARLEADALRDEKVKVLRSIRPISPESVGAHAVRAQYAAGVVHGQAVPGYRDEPGVARDSSAETFAAAKFYVDNWRWRGVPFYLRTGKRMARQTSLIAIRFRQPPQLLFDAASPGRSEPNWIVLAIQPSEGMYIELHAKQPGLMLQTRLLRLNASYRQTHPASSEAYKTLLLDVIEGDRSLFLRFDEVEWAWRVVEPILNDWATERGSIQTYPAGTWGPPQARRLFEQDDDAWRNEA
jgi:glucose-6-phosphate 1-dehydrogenase